MKSTVLNSLQGQYALVSTLVSIIFLGAAYFSHLQFQDARTDTTENIVARSQLHKYSLLIRDAVWHTQQSLATFMVNPGSSIQRKHIEVFLQDAQTYTDRLRQDLLAQGQQHETIINHLQTRISELGKEIKFLAKVRLDANRQYPALVLTRETMLTSDTEFFSATALILGEVTETTTHNHNMLSYQAFVQARHLWTQMASNFRTYMINRLGSFDEAALPAQEQNIVTLYNTLIAHLTSMQELNRQGQFGAQDSTSLQQLFSSAKHWFSDFEKVRDINSEDSWRSDIDIFHDTITPHVETIWQLLFDLDKVIEQAANEDVSALTQVAENQARIFWSFIALCIGLIVIGYYVFRYTVLRPLSAIAHALKAESEGQRGITLPTSKNYETQNLLAAFVSMRKQVKTRQSALEHQALHDNLTELGNRRFLNEHLEQAIKTARREQGNLALIILDLDHFKEVNDTLGHHIGDQFLIKVSSRLSSLMRDSDLITRFGGDEFAILLPKAGKAEAIKVANKIISALQSSFMIQDQQLYVSASIGIAVFPKNGLTVESLIQHADIAMYQAKKNKTGWALYHEDDDQHSVDRLELMSALRSAINENKLQLFYQAKVSLTDGKTEGVEALLRWEHEKHGWIPPESIITMAEQTGLIHELTNWVLETAIQQTHQWQQQGQQLSVAVNLSAYSLQNNDISKQVQNILNNTAFPPADLTLEITENAMMADPDKAAKILTELDSMGVKIAVDDYGSGFSSLGYLKQLPVRELKIDKSFILDMASDENDAVIVRSTIDLAHNLGLRVVAEGVETREIWELLQTLGCDTAQGFFMSSPVNAENFTQWLQTPKLLPSLGKNVSAIHSR